MAKINLTGVSKNFPGQNAEGALRDINLEIRDREFFVVAGSADAGKSTLLRVLAGLEEVSGGEISIADGSASRTTRRENVAMVFAGDSLYPAMTVAENVAFGLKRRHFEKSKIERQARDAAAALRLDELLGRNVSSLSFEQRQRTAIARAIARQPGLLLLDEPFAKIGENERDQLHLELRQLHDRSQTTTVYATADPRAAFSLADRVAILEDGALAQVGSPAEIYDAPASVSVARFFGRPPMNFIRGEFRRERDGFRFIEEGEGTIAFPIPLPNDFPPDLVGRPLLLGIWPEELEVTDSADGTRDAAVFFPVIIEHLEPGGTETILNLQTGAHTIVCRSRLRIDREKNGRRIKLKLNIAKLRLFDALSGKRILLTTLG